MLAGLFVVIIKNLCGTSLSIIEGSPVGPLIDPR